LHSERHGRGDLFSKIEAMQATSTPSRYVIILLNTARQIGGDMCEVDAPPPQPSPISQTALMGEGASLHLGGTLMVSTSADKMLGKTQQHPPFREADASGFFQPMTLMQHALKEL
jgi:hypothetical protein